MTKVPAFLENKVPHIRKKKGRYVCKIKLSKASTATLKSQTHAQHVNTTVDHRHPLNIYYRCPNVVKLGPYL